MASAVCMTVGFPKASAERKEIGDVERVRLPEDGRNRRVLIVGGTGVTGSNTAVALSKLCPHLHIVVGGRNRQKGDKLVATLGENSEFAQVDIGDIRSLAAAMNDVDLVVNAAGPFDYLECNVLEAAIQSKTAYIDVSDSKRYGQLAKSYKNKAMAAGVPAITNCGINPGVSNLMAAVLVHNAQSESRGQPESLRFNYYTCGSGGTGPGVLATSFFLFGDEAVTYHKGEKVKFSPYSNMLNIDFGEGVGKKEAFLLNLPEVESAHEILRVPTVSGRFGTGPSFWNRTISAIIRLVPAKFLRDQRFVQLLVQFSYPLIRAVDVISGETMSIKVDLECSDGYNTTAIYSRKRLSEAAGLGTAAFALAVLEGSTKPGVWYPEEPEGIAIEARETLLRRAADGATNAVIIKSFCTRKQTEQVEVRNMWDMFIQKSSLTT